jgi:hypothetical protein
VQNNLLKLELLLHDGLFKQPLRVSTDGARKHDDHEYNTMNTVPENL